MTLFEYRKKLLFWLYLPEMLGYQFHRWLKQRVPSAPFGEKRGYRVRFGETISKCGLSHMIPMIPHQNSSTALLNQNQNVISSRLNPKKNSI